MKNLKEEECHEEEERHLCQKCIDFYMGMSYGTYLPPWIHCHHDDPKQEPEEEPFCCVCLNGTKHGLSYSDTLDRVIIRTLAKFCPECGRKIKDLPHD